MSKPLKTVESILVASFEPSCDQECHQTHFDHDVEQAQLELYQLMLSLVEECEEWESDWGSELVFDLEKFRTKLSEHFNGEGEI